VEEKIVRKHRVYPEEVEEVFLRRPYIRFMEENSPPASISQARSLAEMAEFWDTHDATDFDAQTHEVPMEFDLRTRRHYLAIDPEILTRLRVAATARGLSAESLANLWLQERLLTAPAGKTSARTLAEPQEPYTPEE